METLIHIVGAGGIGVALGYALNKAGCNVTMVEKVEDKIRNGQQIGLTISGEGTVKVPFIAFAEWQAPDNTIILLCCKTFDNQGVLARINNNTILIPVQNGFDTFLDEQQHFGEAIASFVSECERDRPYTRITRPGKLHIGPRHKASPEETAILRQLSSLLLSTSLFVTEYVDDVLPYKATKLMYNAAISPLAASAGIDNATLLSNKLAKKLFFQLIQENYVILKNAGYRFAKIGPFHPDTVTKILKTPGLPELMAVFFKPSLRGTYCSMAPDMGNEHTEIDAYNGHLVKLAADFPCPYNKAAVAMVNHITKARLRPDYNHLELMREQLTQMGISV